MPAMRQRREPPRHQRKMVAMSDKTSQPIDLKPAMIQFLDDVVKTHKLDDAGKAVRCLVNYARENPDKHEEIFGEVRCLDC
jgi:hypothetical protein